ncbi:uncharacterized protein LOC114522310 [Dendronephthya gigantea]|uniref:uncharacterized protein LOC114522310 n=1 Tax=Dendronephthya gigantea TaxID=151771 RepID=UPI001069CAF3|nr:uncharacterized protein LOC114522310 [Dendronephthya gigantea]
MGSCVSTSDNKVNPPSNEKIIHVEPQESNFSEQDFSEHGRSSEGKLLETSACTEKVIQVRPCDSDLSKSERSLEGIKTSPTDRELINGRYPEGYDGNNDENFHAKSSERCLRNNNETSIDNDPLNGRLSEAGLEDREESNCVLPRVKYGLPPKSVRFDVDFNDVDTNSRSTPRKFPRRLKKLEGMPQLTAEQLRKKQEQAEQNRAMELQRKTDTLSKHNRDLFQAREYERLKNAQIQMEQKFLVNERNRRNHMKGVIIKQQERETRAKNIREKLNMELEGSVVHIDETYNSGNSSDDDWNGGEKVEKSGAQEDDSTDEFFENTPVRANLCTVINNPRTGFASL